MTIRQVTKDGKIAFQWGNHGPVFTGPWAKQKAEEVGKALQKHGLKKSSGIKQVHNKPKIKGK